MEMQVKNKNTTVITGNVQYKAGNIMKICICIDV